ncbi:MAG: oligosaccharide flippase family protein [Deltaproteobacteria bacterium]|nr:oligosaccharide flippase family protein [Deltaproteobacteria bacterium]
MGTFFSNISKLTFSRGLSIGLGLVSTPILSRLYRPEDFGAYGVVFSVAAWFTAFACLGYNQAIPLAAGRQEARTLVRLCMWLSALLTLVATAICGPGGPWLADLLGEPQLAPYLWLVPLLFLIDSIKGTSESILAREGRFGVVSVASLIDLNLARLVSILWALMLTAGILGLIVGNLIASSLSLVIALTVGIKVLWSQSGDDGGPAVSYRQAIKNHIQFPKINLWNNLLKVSTGRMPVFILAAYFDPAVVGFFTFATNIISLPLRVLGNSVADVFYPEAAREWSESGSVERALHFAVKFQATVGIFPMVALGLLGPLFFEVVFSFRWTEAGVLSQILAFWTLMNFITAPISSLFLIVNRAGTRLMFSIMQLAVTLLSLLAGGIIGNVRLSLAIMSLSLGLVSLMMFIRILRLGKAKVWSNIGVILKEVGYSLLTLLPAAAAFYFLELRWSSLGLVVLGAMAYFGMLYWRDREIHERVLRVMGRRPDIASPLDHFEKKDSK